MNPMNASEPREDAPVVSSPELVALWLESMVGCTAPLSDGEDHNLRVAAKLIRQQAAALARQGADPVAWQFREAGTDHDWSLCINRKHADDTAASPDWEVRALVPATGAPR